MFLGFSIVYVMVDIWREEKKERGEGGKKEMGWRKGDKGER